MSSLHVAYLSGPWGLTGCVTSLRLLYCLLCLQAVTEKKADAVATVVAAVDLARVRQPVPEGSWAEEAFGMELEQDVALSLEEQAVAIESSPADSAVSTDQHRVQTLQVRGLP